MSTIKSKKCPKCGENKPLTGFHRNRTKKDGLAYECKSCAKEERRRHYQENREYEKERSRKYRQENKEACKERDRKYRQENKEAIKKRDRKYREENKEVRKEYNKKYMKDRYANDPEFRTSCLLRTQTRRLGDFKNTTTIELVGCSPAEFWIMNGSPSIEELQDLHIDHVVPMSWFDLSNEDHVKVCCHFLNLQYLTAKDNLKKNNSYMGSPDNILAYKEDFDIDAHVAEMLVIIKSLN